MTAPGIHYLDHACCSPPSQRTVAAVQQAAAQLSTPGSGGATGLALDWLAVRDRVRRSVARLLDSTADAITLVDSTTHGLGIVAAGLELRPGDNVVVPDCEFLGLTTVWRRHQHRGVQLRSARSRRGAVALDELAAAVDHRTRVIALSAVQEVSGAPVDLDAVSDIAARAGALVLVDGIQEAGVLRREPDRHGIAAFAAGGHKWLRSPFGLGFLWTSDELRQRLQPAVQGYFALTDPPQGWARLLHERDRTAGSDLPFRHDGGALETGGTPNWLGAVGLGASIDELLATGLDHIEHRALTLADRLREALARLGIDVLTPPGTRSAIVTFDLDDEQRTSALHQNLHDAGVHQSLRGIAGIGGVRASCHGHNSADDIDALVDLTATFLRSDSGMLAHR
ncbi:MAG TPA: aminotransferase class V-fold PLP-dependent enzyme [Jiangellales bacterium]|nr:aminotransferase class V-fold PLP-dependent enzyme [Jiangellales bacterium]